MHLHECVVRFRLPIYNFEGLLLAARSFSLSRSSSIMWRDPISTCVNITAKQQQQKHRLSSLRCCTVLVGINEQTSFRAPRFRTQLLFICYESHNETIRRCVVVFAVVCV